MAIFERLPLDAVPVAADRWTPLYLEHGRLEVDDSSVKWIGADGAVVRIPVATVSALLLGPGTSVTHAAIRACADCRTPVCWIGESGLHFYAAGTAPTSDSHNARKQAEAHASRKKRAEIARRLFAKRFPSEMVAHKSIDELRGMEGKRVREMYARKGEKYGVTWRGRRYDQNCWDLADNINRAISAANAALYALTTSVVCSLGYLPALGFIHTNGPLAFVYDLADIYKPQTTLEAAFHALSLNPEAGEKEVLALLKMYLEQEALPQRIVTDLEGLWDDDGTGSE